MPSSTPEEKDFLRTAKSMADFAMLMVKVRDAAASNAHTDFSPDECRTMIWALRLLRRGPVDEGGPVPSGRLEL